MKTTFVLLCGFLSSLALLAEEPVERVRHFAVILSGYPIDEQHAAWYWNSSAWIHRVLRDKYGYPEEAIYALHDDPQDAERRNQAEPKAERRVQVDGQANAENLRAVCAHLASIVEEGDQVLLYVIGHARFDGERSLYLMSGGEFPDEELAKLADAIHTRDIHGVFSPCEAEGFLRKLARPGRVVIVSTRADEGNRAGVAESCIRGLENDANDLDKDGRLSLYEAYLTVVREQEEWYKTRGLTQTEHALIDDDGDGQGHYLPEAPGSEGELARGVFLGDQGRPLGVSAEGLRWLTEQNATLALDHVVPVKPYRK